MFFQKLLIIVALGNLIIRFLNIYIENSMIISCKSSPLFEENSASKVNRSSKRPSKHRDSNEYEHHKVQNPFQGKQSGFLPQGLLQQINNLDYLTPNHVQKICWEEAVHVPRRSSVFTKHLQAMQQAVRQQQNKVGPVNKAKVSFDDQMQDQNSLSLDEKCEYDLISCDSRQRWALQPMQFEMDGLQNLHQGQQQIIFQSYSMTEVQRFLQPPDWDDYFNQ